MRDRLLSLEHRDASGGVLLSQTYRYDAAGNRLQVTETGGEESRYQYDGLHRLVSEQVWQSGQLLDERQYVWDAVSNLVALTHNGMTTDYQYDSGGRLIQKGGEPLFYTPKGQLSEWHSGRGKREYQWDARGRLRQVKAPGVTLAYGYDAADRRIERVHNGSRQQYLLDGVYSHWPQVLAEYGSGGMTAWHDYGLGRVRRDGHTVLADALGSTRALVDSQGAVSARYRYDAQGQLRESSGSQASQPFRYTGEFWEDGADAYHLRARDYLPELGRFNQRDSWQGDRQRPITLNAYLYGDANPVMNIDPSGNMSMMGMNISMPMVVSAVSFAARRGIVNCGKATASFMTGPAGMAMVKKTKFLKMLRGTALCGIAGWGMAFHIANRLAAVDEFLAPNEGAAAHAPNWGASFDGMKKELNTSIWGMNKQFGYDWHHIVEKNQARFPRPSINSILNVVPTWHLVHDKITGFYMRHHSNLGGKISLRKTFENIKHNYQRQWAQGIKVWDAAVKGEMLTQDLLIF